MVVRDVEKPRVIPGCARSRLSKALALVSASGIIEPRDMMRYGLVATLISALILGLFFYVISVLNLI